MRTLVGSSLLACATAGVIAFRAPPALASTTWTVSGGPNLTATSTSAVFKDQTSNQPIHCTSLTFSGSVPNGTGLSGTGIAHFANGSSSGCTGNLGSHGTVTLVAGTFNAISYDPSTAIVKGTITGAVIAISLNDLLGPCTATATGELDNVTYNNWTRTLTIIADNPPKLTIVSASGSGCAGLIAVGDKVSFSGSFAVSSNITITYT
jgi:hypothetical protein